MEKDWVDVVLPVIMVALSVVGLFSKKKQQRQRAQERRARALREFMVEDPEPDPESGFGFDPGPEEEAAAPPPVQPFTDPQQEGQCVVEHHPAESEGQARETLEIDPKKLVLYSEIMKPKFDEGLD